MGVVLTERQRPLLLNNYNGECAHLLLLVTLVKPPVLENELIPGRVRYLDLLLGSGQRIRFVLVCTNLVYPLEGWFDEEEVGLILYL